MSYSQHHMKHSDVQNNKCSVTVIGLGRVGLPFSLALARAGNTVYGVDQNPKIIEELNHKKAPFFEPGMEEILQDSLNNNYYPISDIEKATRLSEIIVIMVGGGLTERGIDTSSLEKIFSGISNYISGKTIILRTTVTIGTTERFKNWLETKTGMKEGKDFWMAFAPERVIEGKALEECCVLPIPIGAFNSDGYERSKKLFNTIGNRIIKLDNPKQAELLKLVDNSYRNMQFAFANEIAVLAEFLGIDGIKVIEAANESYPRNKIAYPSYGVSGYCLSKDPYFFEEAFKDISQERGFHSISYYARKSNDYLIEKIQNTISNYSQYVTHNDGHISVLIAGLCFKEDVDDFRLSHGLELVRRLLTDKRYRISVYDPYLDSDSGNRYVSIPDDIRNDVNICNNIEDAFRNKDIAVFTVKHKSFIELERERKIFSLIGLMRQHPLVIDGWNIFSKLYEHRLCKDGFDYVAPGRLMWKRY
jgi:UDP-N-acetyl-D-mannosaminuronic acid dehydrogenase